MYVFSSGRTHRTLKKIRNSIARLRVDDALPSVEVATTEPVGFLAFYPGPGLGGHCIPIDPFYLTWKAREYGKHTRFIELAGEINTAMPEHIVHRIALR